MKPFNELNCAEAERLALLLEELGEAQQAIGKILRHGYQSKHPDGGPTNRQSLEKECGDVRYAMIQLCEAGDLSKQKIHDWADAKREAVKKYLHHQVLTVSEFDKLLNQLYESSGYFRQEFGVRDLEQFFNAGRESVCSQREAYQRGYKAGRRKLQEE